MQPRRPMMTESADAVSMLRDELRAAGLPVTDPAHLDAIDRLATVSSNGTVQPLDSRDVNSLVKKIRALRHCRRKAMAQVAAVIKRTEREEKALLGCFGEQAKSWLKTKLIENGGCGTRIQLAAGEIGFRLEPVRSHIEDEVALRSWCKQCLPEALGLTLLVDGNQKQRVCEWMSRRRIPFESRDEILQRLIEQYFQETGELPDGFTLLGGNHELYVL